MEEYSAGLHNTSSRYSSLSSYKYSPYIPSSLISGKLVSKQFFPSNFSSVDNFQNDSFLSSNKLFDSNFLPLLDSLFSLFIFFIHF
jgi:hypothetical protein